MRAGAIDQRAAVRRIGADRAAEFGTSRASAAPLAPWPCSTSGASAAIRARNAVQRVNVARTELARDGDALVTRAPGGRKLRKNGFGAGAAGRAVDDQADAMAALGLTLHQSTTWRNRPPSGARKTCRIFRLAGSEAPCGVASSWRTTRSAGAGVDRSGRITGPCKEFLKARGKKLSPIETLRRLIKSHVSGWLARARRRLNRMATLIVCDQAWRLVCP